jgi:hypothetical protein
VISNAIRRARAFWIALRNTVFVQRALTKAGMICCRHNYILVQEKHRVYLRCPTCTRETPGVPIGETSRPNFEV